MKKIFNSHLKLWFLIALEFIKRHKGIFSVSFFIVTVVLFAQIKFKLLSKPYSISIGFIGTYQEHDLPAEVTELISQPLVETDENGKVKGKLVIGWDINNDATVFKFKLKDNLRWIDNSEVKSKDIGFAIPGLEQSYPDDKTIQFNLKEPYSPLPSLLTKPVIKRGTMIGMGPYKIAKLEKSRVFITKIVLKSVNPQLPVIYVRFYPNEKVGITGFNLGEVQALLGISNPKVFSNNSQTKLQQKTDYSKMVTILFQTKNPLLSNRSLRQALAYATPKIDSEEIANNPYPSFLWAYNPDSKKYLGNIDLAKSALERAKSSISDEKLKEELILTTTPNLEEVGNKVISSWKDLGLDIKLRIESGIPQNFAALLITQSIPKDPDQYFLWHATQTKTNLTGYDSKRTDKDLEDGRKIITLEDRQQKYFDFQKSLLEDAPATFLYFPKYNIVYLKKSEKLLDKILRYVQTPGVD
ncbi:hypothetical protein HYW41_02690 [Candidatus Daviesbacteria bacterium]|nr:hypothetical protein [Candidatus Daviesbacteria bacterium]